MTQTTVILFLQHCDVYVVSRNLEFRALNTAFQLYAIMDSVVLCLNMVVFHHHATNFDVPCLSLSIGMTLSIWGFMLFARGHCVIRKLFLH